MTTSQTARSTVAAKKPGRPARAVKPVEQTKETLAVSKTVLIHFVDDGFTAFGYVWSRGQELEIKKPSTDYDRTCDSSGRSWLEFSPEEQIIRWGTVKFRSGPSSVPNSVLEYTVIPGDGVDLSGRPKFQGYMAQQEREKAAKAERERGRNIPAF